MRRTVLAVVLGFLVLSCDSEGPTTPDPRVAAVVVVPAADTVLLAGEPVRFTATATDAAGGEVVGAKFDWKSSAPAVATVDATGLVHGIAAGSATITASNGLKEGQASVLVSSFTVLAGAGACNATGTNHSALINDPTTWTRAASPHHVLRTISVLNTLTIEPGAVICAYPAVTLEITSGAQGVGGEMLARGTAQNPITFTAQNPGQYWGGLHIFGLPFGDPDSTHISHAVIEYAVNGVLAETPVTVDSSHIRQIRESGVSLSGGRVAFSVIDTAGVGISISSGTAEENIIRGAVGNGIALTRSSGAVTLNGGRIEGSGGVGLNASFDYKISAVVAGRPIRVVGGKSYGAVLSLGALRLMYPARADQDSLLGNAKDTLYTGGTMGSGEVVLRRDLPWVVSSNTISADAIVGQGGTIRVEPGASMMMRSVRLALNGGRLVARGTASAPISISGDGLIALSGVTQDTSFLTNARIKQVRLGSYGGNLLVIDSTAMSDGSSIELRSRGSRIAHSSVEGGPFYNSFCIDCGLREPLASVTLGAPGVSLVQTSVRNSATHAIVIDSASVVVSDCAVSGNNGDAVRVTASGGAVVHTCNFAENAGAGLNNLGTTAVDATNNWWGDAAGPAGQNGDGVAGNVNYQPYRTSPSATGTEVNRVVIRAGAPTVATADTTRYVAEAQDANGNVILRELIGWRTADSSIAAVDANGLVVGLKVGTTQLVAYARSDPAKQSTTTLDVVAGALVLKWRDLPNTGIAGFGPLWAASANDFFVGTSTGVARMDSTGSVISPEMPGSYGFGVAAFWGSSANDVWAVGGLGALHFNGVAWTLMSGQPAVTYTSVSGSGPNDVYFAGGLLWHFDGNTWTSTTTLPSACTRVQVRARNDVFALCDGLVYHYDGTSWVDLHAPVTALELWVSATRVTVVGTADNVARSARWDGANWTTFDMNATQKVEAVTGFSDSALFAIGSTDEVRFFDGATWHPVWTGFNPSSLRYAYTFGDAVYLVGGLSGQWHILRGTR